MHRISSLIAALTLLGTPLAAQQPAAAPAPMPAVVDSADVKTLDGIMNALYASISADAGQTRNWDRFKSLFAPGARMIPTFRRQSGEVLMRSWGLDEYVERATPGFANGFHEREIARRTETYGPIVHLMSTYESRRATTEAQPFQRGVNSFQLYNDGARWYIVTIFWAGETPVTPIPARYLTSENH